MQMVICKSNGVFARVSAGSMIAAEVFEWNIDGGCPEGLKHCKVGLKLDKVGHVLSNSSLCTMCNEIMRNSTWLDFFTIRPPGIHASL